jgi:hypothetical protein
MASPGRRAHVLYVVALTAVGTGLVAATLIVLGSTGESASCAQFPSCLVTPATWIGAVHVIAAGLLLLLTLAMVVLAVGLRTEPGHLVPATVAAFLVLVGMASVGAGLASGAIPLRLAAIQFVFLGVLIALIAGAAWGARRIACAPYGSTGPPSL